MIICLRVPTKQNDLSWKALEEQLQEINVSESSIIKDVIQIMSYEGWENVSRRGEREGAERERRGGEREERKGGGNSINTARI